MKWGRATKMNKPKTGQPRQMYHRSNHTRVVRKDFLLARYKTLGKERKRKKKKKRKRKKKKRKKEKKKKRKKEKKKKRKKEKRKKKKKKKEKKEKRKNKTKKYKNINTNPAIILNPPFTPCRIKKVCQT